jgi:predicted dehydrogenase
LCGWVNFGTQKDVISHKHILKRTRIDVKVIRRGSLSGTKGRIEIAIPFNAPKDRPTSLFIDASGDLSGSGITTEEFPTADQYTMQGDAFSKAVLEGTEVPVPLEDAIANMAVIEAVFRSGETGQWERPQASS